MRFSAASAALSLALLYLPGCDNATPPLETAAPAFARAAPAMPPAGDFVRDVDNRYFPLSPGTVRTYRSATDEGEEITRVTVTNQTKRILGIRATVVHDEVLLNGSLIEDTYDWFAQDAAGNVWYLGEASCEMEEGECVSTEGSWEAGVDGAVAGIIMWADPAAHTGETYQQEYYEGIAEDRGKVLHTGLSVQVPAGQFNDCVETMDWTPLEPGGREHKYYCAGIGMVLEVATRNGGTRNELVIAVP
ncbi:MAG TPA: hypothetical protein VGD27_16375 [Longimicrobiales bacterium]